MAHQLPLGFLQAFDDENNGTIDGMEPWAWLGRRYYATADEALQDARRVSSLIIGPVYVVEHEVYPGFERYWPHSTYWQATTHQPFYGQVIGAFYHPKPNHYIVRLGSLPPEVFERGESPEEIERKSKEAWGNFHAKNKQ